MYAHDYVEVVTDLLPILYMISVFLTFCDLGHL